MEFFLVLIVSCSLRLRRYTDLEKLPYSKICHAVSTVICITDDTSSKNERKFSSIKIAHESVKLCGTTFFLAQFQYSKFQLCSFSSRFHFNSFIMGLCYETLHKKGNFPLTISSVNVTKSPVSCGFDQIY